MSAKATKGIYVAQIWRLAYHMTMPHQGTLAPRPLHIGPQGRVVIPAEYRRALGVEAGDTLVLWLEGDRLALRRRQAVEEELWGLMTGVKGSLAEELLSQRREDAQRETAG